MWLRGGRPILIANSFVSPPADPLKVVVVSEHLEPSCATEAALLELTEPPIPNPESRTSNPQPREPISPKQILERHLVENRKVSAGELRHLEQLQTGGATLRLAEPSRQQQQLNSLTGKFAALVDAAQPNRNSLPTRALISLSV